MRLRSRLKEAVLLFLFAGLSSPLPALAQADPAPPSGQGATEPQRGPEPLEQAPVPPEVPASQGPPAAQAPSAPATPTATAAPTATAGSSGAGATSDLSGAPGKGLTVTVGDPFSLNVRSRIQLRYQLNVPPEDAAGERDLQQLVSIGTARLWFSGHIYNPKLTYMIQLALAGRDFRDGVTSPVFDAYLDWKVHRDLSVRAGQFFVPFDRLRTVREFALQLADRPRPVGELTLDRDVGVTLYSDRFLGDRSPVAWRLGVFGGGGTNLSAAKEPGALLVGRIELRPLGPIDDDSEGDLERRKKPGLAIGGAFARNWNTNRLRSTSGATFSGGTTDYSHAAADAVFKWSGLALQAEYLWKRASIDQILSTGPDDEPVTEPTRSGRGWVLQASYVFDPPIEIVGRLSRMYASGGTDPSFVKEADTRGQEVAAGLNYYLNGHRLKIQTDWIARTPPNFDFSRADHLVHVQLDATF